MKKFTPFKTGAGSGAKPITLEQALTFLTPDEITAGEKRGHLVSRGPWGIAHTYAALATATPFPKDEHGVTHYGQPSTIFGWRTLTHCKESGHELEGQVSVGGKAYRGFTSHQLFELPDGKLVDVATIHVCGYPEGSEPK